MVRHRGISWGDSVLLCRNRYWHSRIDSENVQSKNRDADSGRGSSHYGNRIHPTTSIRIGCRSDDDRSRGRIGAVSSIICTAPSAIASTPSSSVVASSAITAPSSTRISKGRGDGQDKD